MPCNQSSYTVHAVWISCFHFKAIFALEIPLKILSSSRTCVGLWSTSEVHQEALKPWQAFKPSGSMESGHISNLLLSAFSCLHSKGAGPQHKICRIIEEITHVWPLSFLKLKANARGKRSWCTGNCTEIGKYTEEPTGQDAGFGTGKYLVLNLTVHFKSTRLITPFF